MKKFLLTTSVILLGISSPLQAETFTTDNLQTKNILCTDSSRIETSPNFKNFLIAQQPVDPVIIGPSTGPEENCSYYIVRDKYGDIFDCRKCTYGGPYCFRRE